MVRNSGKRDMDEEGIGSETNGKLDDDIDDCSSSHWQSSLAPAMILPRG